VVKHGTSCRPIAVILKVHILRHKLSDSGGHFFQYTFSEGTSAENVVFLLISTIDFVNRGYDIQIKIQKCCCICDDNTDKPVCWTSPTRDFVPDLSNVAPFTPMFLSVGTCLLHVILVYKIESIA